MADSSSGSASTRKIQVALGRYSPALVRVERSDEDALKIKPTGKRGRWQRVIEAMPDDATQVFLLDKTGATLWTHKLIDESVTPASKRVEETNQLLQLVMDAADQAQRRSQQFVEVQVGAFVKVINIMTDRLTHLERNYSSVLQLAADSAAKPVGEQSEVEQQNALLMNTVLKAGVERGMDKVLGPAKPPPKQQPQKGQPNGTKK